MQQSLEACNTTFDHTCINTIRTLSMDAVQKANSGHPGAPMGLAPVAYTLFSQILKHNPKNPDWPDRDRFVLSAGHASMLLYSVLHLTGYDVSLQDIKQFRQMDSITPGHPEWGHTPGVETTTGPLGQGFANAVGMAIAERHLALRFNRPGYTIVDHQTYVICGDGDMMEGLASEAASLAGHLGLGKLTVIYDDNKISIEGGTEIAFTEDVALRFKAYGWHVQRVEDGNDIQAIRKAIDETKAEQDRPSIILLRTHIAYGSPNKQDSSGAHGAPLGEDEIKLTKKNLGWPEDQDFYVPNEVLLLSDRCIQKGADSQAKWQGVFSGYKEAYPDLAKQWTDDIDGKLADGWDADIPSFVPSDGPIATRAASGKVLNGIAKNVLGLIGGSADLAPSNKTIIESSHDFQKDRYDGRNLRFGVREHAMGGVISGMALHAGVRPYGGTFLVFADYMRPSIRLAALMGIPVTYVFTHDSVAVGEDGPTHQPVEHLASLRVIPNLTVIRPADAAETAEAWRQAMTIRTGPVALILSRQKLPVIDRNHYGSEKELGKGAYVLYDSDDFPKIILIATGSEIHIALEAVLSLKKKGIAGRVVSMPSWELFEKTGKEYQKSVLPPEITARIAIEAGSKMGWERYVGSQGVVLGIAGYGISAPGGAVLSKFGFEAECIVKEAEQILKG
jgi:transketolase